MERDKSSFLLLLMVLVFRERRQSEGQGREGKCLEDRAAYTLGYMIDMKMGKGK